MRRRRRGGAGRRGTSREAAPRDRIPAAGRRAARRRRRRAASRSRSTPSERRSAPRDTGSGSRRRGDAHGVPCRRASSTARRRCASCCRWRSRARRAQHGPVAAPHGTIDDRPRFAWRGAMLDVARHFFGVEDVKRYIDLMALYKLNRLHLHLTDDQGWRLAIGSWPRLARHGGSTEVGGGTGGFYTQREYAEIVAYARRAVRRRWCPRSTCRVTRTRRWRRTRSSTATASRRALVHGHRGRLQLALHPQGARRTAFVDDVVREVAALTPGPYLHIGGDEAQATTPRTTSTSCAASQAHRAVARQADGRVGGDRAARGSHRTRSHSTGTTRSSRVAAARRARR